MYRTLHTLFCLAFATLMASSLANANASEFTLEQASRCILLNKDLNLASSQLIKTETKKAEMASKIHYLERIINERRTLIEQLDQIATHENNKNYNQLVLQFENLTQERRESIADYNQQHQLHIVQHESVIRLEQRFTSQCLNNIQLSESVYQQACDQQTTDIRWCQAFSFD